MIKHRIVITSGDSDGIGLEITQKALRRISLPKDTQLVVFKSPRLALSVPHKFTTSRAQNLKDALALESQIVVVSNNSPPPNWVEESAQFAIDKKVSCIVTAPLSKELIIESGFSDIGHTDILKRVSGSKSAFMGFFGSKFNVVLASGHVPTKSVETSLDKEKLVEVLSVVDSYKKYLPKAKQKLPIGLLGLNPHAGDRGIIGDFEIRVIKPALEKARGTFSVEGPLIPDVAFQPQNWKKYSLYIALYHDQGLIPFKMAHGFKGAHLTLGLPIHRSSVDHGTAKDIFGKNRANPGSMIDALKWGIRLAKGK